MQICLRPSLRRLDQARLFEHFHVLRCAGEGHAKRLAKFADRFLAEREARKHSAPGRVGKRPKRRIESIFNHVVYFRLCGADCQPIS